MSIAETKVPQKVSRIIWMAPYGFNELIQSSEAITVWERK